MRRIPLSRRSHIIGFQAQAASGLTEHESTLERDFVTLTMFQDPAAKIVAQPVTLDFLDHSTARRYTPDYLVHWSDARSELIEVKYRVDLHAQWRRLRPAFLAARAWAHAHDAGFRIATERAIRGPLLENAKRLLPLRTATLDSIVAEQVRVAIKILKSPTFGDIASIVPSNRAAALGALWRMIARGELRTDLSVPLGLHTPLGLP